MLLNSFFTIVNVTSQDDKTLAKVEINKEHSVFEGHFPGNPVVPGVFLVQMIRETLEVLNQKKFRIDKSDEIKFMNMVLPQQTSHLVLEIQKRVKSENPFAFSIMVTDEQTTFLKMKIDFHEI
jgi:3-hydroxyacyl-[acyl-carrier-protein] dehydratase